MNAGSLLLLALQTGAPADADARFRDALARPVARVGLHEVKTGEIVEAARPFFPKVADELKGEYGERFLDSDAFDRWIDAYVDLLVLRRDARVRTLLPDSAALERALAARAEALERAPLAPDSASTASKPTPDPTLLARTRRLHGFEVARQEILDELVPEIRDPEVLRQHMQAFPWQTTARARVRTIQFSTRDRTTGKRLPRAHRLQIREDAERVLARLREGEPFANVVQQVEGSRPWKATDTLPWMSFQSPLPAPFVYAILRANAGDLVGPIETADGYVIAKVEERAVKPAPEFEKITTALAEDARRHAQFELLQKLRSNVEVVVY